MPIKKTKRQQKYPDTATYKYVNRNPKGRVGTGDCVYRAISDALGKDWCEVVRELADLACETGYCPNYDDNFNLYLERQGFKKHKQPRHADNTKYTLAEFIDEHLSGTYVVNLPHHLTVVKAGKCHDTWDCTKLDSRVGNFWCKKEIKTTCEERLKRLIKKV